MRPPNARPDRVPEHLQWTRIGIDLGKSVKGWLAGPVFGCEGHGTPAFKPCHHLFTGGAKSCPWCAIDKFKTVKFQGYLPMYDERLKRVVVCVNLDVTTQCDSLPLLNPIELVKGKFKTSPVWLKGGEPWTTLKPSGPKVRATAQDLLPWLVGVLWKAEGLQEYADALPAVAGTPAGTPAETPAETPAGTPAARGELAKKMRERGWNKSALFFDPDGAPADKPGTNGKHHKPKG